MRQSGSCKCARMAPQGHEPHQLSCQPRRPQGSGTARSSGHTGPQMPATSVCILCLTLHETPADACA